MTGLQDPARAIAAHIGVEPALVEQAVFGTTDPARIAQLMDEFCFAYLQGHVRGTLFYQSSVGCTHGVELDDGWRLVIKVRPPAEANPDLHLDRAALAHVVEVMHWLAAQGFPCPRPIVGPVPLGLGLATAELFFEQGTHGDGFDPTCRRTIAGGLAALLALLADMPGEHTCLRGLQRRPDALYPQPHSPIFDFEATAAGAGWIDDFARRALARDTFRAPPVLGHGDWRVEHLRFDDGRIVASFDWDSLAMRREVELVGIAAFGFTADWSRESQRRTPRRHDIEAFVADYERAREQPFTAAERAAVFANVVYTVAYGARCGHALSPHASDWPDDSWQALLRNEGEALLAQA